MNYYSTQRLSSNATSPFVSIDKKWLYVILAYIILYNIVNPIVSEILTDSAPLAFPRLVVQIIYQFVLFGPLFFYRKNWGWLHPLIFPIIFNLLKDLGKDPFSLLEFFNFSAPTYLMHPTLPGWSEYEVAIVFIKADLLRILSLLAYYTAFLVKPKLSIPKLNFKKLRGFKWKSIVLLGISFLLFTYFVIRNGGINKLILAFAGSRFEAFEGTGHIRAVINTFCATATLSWYAFKPESIKNPLFIAAFIFTVLVGFFVSGSRSSIFFTLALFLMIWMIRNRAVPAGKTVIIVLVGFLFIGVLGELRKAGLKSDTLDWSIVTDTTIEERISSTTEHISQRHNGYIAVVGRAISEEGLLWGRTYLGAVFFWLPRAIWEGKPRGAGAYTANIIIREGTLEDNPSGGTGGGIPPGGVGEAYWNFHIPGIIFVYFMYGMMMKWLADFFRRYPYEPAVWVIYVVALFHISPVTNAFISFLQTITPLVVFLYWVHAFRIRK